MAKTARTPPASQVTGHEPPRSDTAGDAPPPSDVTADSAAATGSQKRGRGRPPKSKFNSSVSAEPARKPSGRPKRNVSPAAAAVSTASATAVVRSGRGRPRRSNTLSATESLATTVDGSRKRGRPKKDDVASPAKKRGRKPKAEQVAKKTVGRPKKATKATTGQGDADPRELKKKAALLQKKVKQAAEKLKIAVSAMEEVQKIAAGM